MNNKVRAKISRIILTVSLSFSAFAAAEEEFESALSGYNEVPAVSSNGTGTLRVVVNDTEDEIAWELSYAGTAGVVTQAHIHFAADGNNGGVSAFLCSNLGNFPVQACPLSPGSVSGTIRAADIIGPSNQGIAAGELNELIQAIKERVAYVNVHTDAFPGGELRAQIKQKKPKKEN
jgi:hypothetical protein